MFLIFIIVIKLIIYFYIPKKIPALLAGLQLMLIQPEIINIPN